MRSNERGIAHLLVIVLVLLGIAATVYLVKNGQNFFPSAQQYTEPNQYTPETSFTLAAGPLNPRMIKLPPDRPTNVTTDKTRTNYHESSVDIPEYVGADDAGLRYNEHYPQQIPQWYSPGQEFSVEVLVRSDIQAAEKFNAHIDYPADLVEVTGISPKMKSDNQICTQNEVYGCGTIDVYCAKVPCPPQKMCKYFGTPCDLPDGWTVEDPTKNCYETTKRSLTGMDYHPSRIIVGFKEGVSAAAAQQLVESLGAKYTPFESEFSSFRYAIVNLPGNDNMVDWLCKFKSQPLVSSAEVDGIVYATTNSTNDSGGRATTTGSTQETSAVTNKDADNGATSESATTIERTIKNKIARKSFITNWSGQHYDNNQGKLYLEGSSVGYLFTVTNQPPVRMATITFKAKKAGKGQISIADSASMMNTANENILNVKRPLNLYIEEPRYLACDQLLPACGPNETLIDERSYTEDLAPGSPGIRCPIYKCVPKPVNCKPELTCEEGSFVHRQRIDENGCTSAASCVVAQGRVCNKEALPSCPEDESLIVSTDDKDGCMSYRCMPKIPANIVPRVCDLAIPACASGQTLINNGAGSDGCPSYSCAFVNNPEVGACDPKKSIVYGNPDNGDGRILCQSTDAEGNSQTISYSFGDFNKDGVINFSDVTYFLSPGYWQE